MLFFHALDLMLLNRDEMLCFLKKEYVIRHAIDTPPVHQSNGTSLTNFCISAQYSILAKRVHAKKENDDDDHDDGIFLGFL